MAIVRPQSGVPAVRRAIAPGAISIPPVLPEANIQGSQPGAFGPEQGTWVKLPGANFTPAGARAVDEVGDGDIAPGASAVLLTVVVPMGLRFRMAGIGFSAEDESALAFLTWSITAPDPIPGYVTKPAAVGSVRNLTEIFVLAGSDAVVSVVAANSVLAATPYHFFARVRGWFYAEKEA